MVLGHLRGEHESKVKVSISCRICVYHQIHSTSSDSIQHTGLGSLGGLSEKCGQNLKYVGRSLCVQWILVISLQQLFCPTFLRFWPHISERHIYQHWMIMTVGRDNLYTSVQLVMWFSVCWSIHYKFFKPNVMPMFSEPSVRAAKQRKD